MTEQSTYTLPGNHELRLRVWNWFRRAVTSAKLTDVTSYGTAHGFRGRGQPGMSGQTGFSLEYGLSQKWVLAMDLARDWSNGSTLRGHDGNGTYIHKTGTSGTDWQIAPAFEYNWNARWGLLWARHFILQDTIRVFRFPHSLQSMPCSEVSFVRFLSIALTRAEFL